MSDGRPGRSYYRIKPDNPLYADMCIIQVGDREVRSRSAKVNICGISPDGLRFSTGLDFPLYPRIMLEFSIAAQEGTPKLKGYLVHKEATGGTEYEYDVCFSDLDQASRQYLLKLLKEQMLRSGRIVLLLRMF